MHGPQHTLKRSWGVLAIPVLALALVLPCSSAHADDWTAGDTIAQGVLTGILYVDYRQTRYVIQHPELGLHEANPILGKYPSTGQLNVYFGLWTVGHAAVAYMLPRRWRDAWQYVYIGAEIEAVHSNYSAGVRILF